MRRAMMLVAVGAVALLVAACTPSVTVENVPTDADGQRSGISVSGRGEVTGTPDTLTMSFGVRVLADSVSDAVAQAAEDADAVIAALRDAGVAEEDIQTTNYSIYPRYDWRNDTQVLLGYEVTNTVVAKIRDLESAGSTIDAVTAAGGDAVTVSGVSFSIEDNDELIEAAREVAWNDAEAKATQLASLSGVDLGEPTAISESFTSSGPPIPFEEAFAADAAGELATPIVPGEQLVAVTLQVQFAIDG
jgi:uncharacterized protein YggE